MLLERWSITMKAILIINMPEGCNKCPLHYDYLHCIIAENMYAKLLETKSREEIKEGYDFAIGHRPKLCPLKPIPVRYGRSSGRQELMNEILGEKNEE